MSAVDIDLGEMSDQQLIDKAGSTYWFDRLNGKSIRVQLYQQNFRRKVLPEGMSGVELWGAFDNGIIPVGCLLMPGVTNRWINVKNDFRDWIEDEDGNPVEPMDKISMLRRGESIDPNDIPALAIRTEKMSMKAFDIEFANVIPIGKTLFKVTPTINSTEIIQITVPMTRLDYEAMEGNGVFDSTPTRNSKKEQRINANPKQIEEVVVLEGFQTRYEIEGEVYLFRDARRNPR